MGTMALTASATGKNAAFEHADDLAKILRRGIARPKYIEFLLHKESSFIGDWLLGVANVYDAPGKRDIFHGGAERLRQANRFHHNIRATAIGKLTEAVVQRCWC
jgi:hypothetical protein